MTSMAQIAKTANISKGLVYDYFENKEALLIKENSDLVVLCKLFENFLNFYDLDYSENVFKHEVNDAKQDNESLRILKSEEYRDKY